MLSFIASLPATKPLVAVHGSTSCETPLFTCNYLQFHRIDIAIACPRCPPIVPVPVFTLQVWYECALYLLSDTLRVSLHGYLLDRLYPTTQLVKRASKRMPRPRNDSLSRQVTKGEEGGASPWENAEGGSHCH